MPICPHCGRTVRKDIPKPDWPIAGSVKNAYDQKVPWNYHRDGTCEHCGHAFYITLFQEISKKESRITTVKAASKQVETGFVDLIAGLSGVEIIQSSSSGTEQSIFISTNELKCMINALQDSPLLEQLDWREDYR